MSDIVVLTFVFMQVTDGLLVGEDDGLVLSDDLPPEVLPTWRQLTQFFQLTHPVHHTMHLRSKHPADALTIPQQGINGACSIKDFGINRTAEHFE